MKVWWRCGGGVVEVWWRCGGLAAECCCEVQKAVVGSGVHV